jgi:Uma2 family endonuclease
MDKMATVSFPMTAAELELMPDDGNRYELVRGELIQLSPAGRQHGNIGFEFGRQFSNFVKAHRLGEVYLAETGFVLNRGPDTVRAPDFAFIHKQRLAEIEGLTGYIPIPPDLAVEVISPDDRYIEVNQNTQDWLNFGVRAVVVINPRTEETTVHRPQGRPLVLNSDATLELPEIVPGWSLALRELFQ